MLPACGPRRNSTSPIRSRCGSAAAPGLSAATAEFSGLVFTAAINALELFIYRYRNEISDEDSDRRLTFHGLRHTYAAEKYIRLTEGGMSAIDANYTVSRLLDHERADATNIYLASVRKRSRDEASSKGKHL